MSVARVREDSLSRGHLSVLLTLLLLGEPCVVAQAQLGGSQGSDWRDDAAKSRTKYVTKARSYPIMDLDGRPWIHPRTVGIRLNQDAIADMTLPNLLKGDDETAFELDDPNYNTRLDSKKSGSGATVGVRVVASDNPHDNLPYQLVYYRDGKKMSQRPINFGATADGITTLPNVLHVPWHTPRSLLPYLVFLSWLIIITFGAYLPFYEARLKAGANVNGSRHLAFFFWWLFALLGYLVVYWLWLPHAVMDMAIFGLLGLVVLFRLFVALRNRGEGPVAEPA